jgi:hypothetical protein
VQLVGAQPLDEERQLGVGDQAVDADLLPEQLGAVGTMTVARDGLAPESLLDGRDVVDRHDPAEPATAERGAGTYGLAERCLVGGGMVEDLHHLQVGVVRERQDHVAGPEAGVHTPVDEVTAEQPPDALGGAGEAVRAGGETQVVQAHAGILRHVVIGPGQGGQVS